MFDSLPGLGACLAFVACVAVATYAQNLTGFALSLILLGLVAVLHIVPIGDAVNAATVITLFNAWSYVRLHRVSPPWQLIRPALLSSLVGVVVGVALLAWLSGGGGLQWLRGLLGLSILGCAVLLVLQSRPLERVSPPGGFVVAGALAGILGGMFSSSGPPLVYHMYRQPLAASVIRVGLLAVFAVNAALRLVLVVASGQFRLGSLVLAACAIPVVYGVGHLNHRYPLRMSPANLRRLVAALLLLAGGSLLVSSVRALIAG
ncbi:MAG: TSUP family transporter [Pseudomonadota bacterium]